LKKGKKRKEDEGELNEIGFSTSLSETMGRKRGDGKNW